MRRFLRCWLAILCLTLGVAGQARGQTTFTVNSVNSVADGVCDTHCSLDDAIIAANGTPGADRIEFAIAPAGDYVFNRTTPLPTITEAVVIDGYTQAGASANTNPVGALNSVIRLSIANQGAVSVGLWIDAPNVTIRGLSILGFTHNLRVTGSSTNITIAGNYLGTSHDGATTHASSFAGMSCDVCAGVTVGGSAPADRNLISGNAGAGIALLRPAVATPMGLTVRGNLIGTNKDANAAIGNGVGITVTMLGSTADDSIAIGGTGGALGVEEGNVIAGNASQGIIIERSTGSDDPASELLIQRNFIGTTYDGAALGNGADGVVVDGAVSGRVLENRIAYNAAAGVLVVGPLTAGGSGVLVRANRMTQNAGMGIDLGGDGRTPNDVDGTDFDTGANDLLNFPFLGQAELDTASGNLAIQGILFASPNRTYTLEFYNNGSNASARANGMDAITPIGTKQVTTNGGGIVILNFTLTGAAVSAGDVIAAVTHDLTARNFSSEISDQVMVTVAPPSISGTITTDGTTPLVGISVKLTGSETRAQTTDASGKYTFYNLTPGGTYTVTPDTAGFSYAPPSISYTNLTQVQASTNFVATVLPQTFTVNVTHDAGTGGCTVSECTLREALTAANAHPGLDTIAFAIPGAGPHFLDVTTSLPAIGGDLLIDGYTQAGATPNTNATGGLNGVLKIALRRGGSMNPGLSALTVTGSHVTIRGLVIASFGTGITIVHPLNTIADVGVTGNYFGTTPDGLSAVPDSGGAVYAGSPADLTVGGSTPAARNLVSGHLGPGITATAGYNGRVASFTVLGNLIGTDATGLVALGNHGDGIAFVATPNPPEADIVRIGGEAPGERNVIAGNAYGLHLERSSNSDLDSSDQQVVGNYIGVGADGATPVGNINTGAGFFGQVKYLFKRNVVANNGGNGVELWTTPTAGGFGVELTENPIFGNGFFAIDLGADQRSYNDPTDSDTGANDLQNYPELTFVYEMLHVTTVNGFLRSRPNRTYRIELFTTGSVFGFARVARRFLDSFLVTTDGAGRVDFSHDVAELFASTERFVATATDVDAMMTSELADDVPLLYGPTALVDVTTTYKGEELDSTTLTLSGDREFSFQTGGQWRFGLPKGGTYVITPSAPGFVFEPASVTLTNITADTAISFVARPAIYTRYLPEGAAGPFWETSIALLNGTNRATTAELSFLKPDGTSTKLDVPLTGPGHAVIDPSTVEGLNGGTFSTVVKASEPVVASRTMRWGEQRELGAHAEQALDESRTSWYFAEGATGCFDLFYLLVNPGATPAEVDVTFIRRAPETPLVKHYTVEPFSRATIQANTEDGLKAAEVSARIEVTNGQPIVAERAMYSRCYGTPWRGGHDAVASAAPAKEWFFAEGATGSFFDLYLLIANFEAQDAQIDVEYLLDDGSTLKKRYTVPAGSRVTIDVAGESPLLKQAAVSAIIRSKNDVPVVAERSQWWPHGGWYEGHASAGVVQTGIEWQIAGAEAGGDRHAQGFLLIANTSDDVASAQVKLVFDDGSVVSLPQPLSLNAHSRTTVALADLPAARNKHFGIIVESLGTTPAPIVVELSTYNDTPDTAAGANGASRFWGAGTNIVATRVR